MKFQAFYNSNQHFGENLYLEGVKDSLTFPNKVNWQVVDDFIQKHRGEYIALAMSYEAGLPFHGISPEESQHFPTLILVVPETVSNEFPEENHPTNSSQSELKPITSKKEYLENVNFLKNEIQLGNIYEVNYCMHFEDKNAQLNPYNVFQSLQQKTEAPFGIYFNFEDWYTMGASPECYLQKVGNKISSKPIKGTRKRSFNSTEDSQLIKELQNSEKERAENVMIVDLVRNDLSKLATKNSVTVEELCKVYSYKTVHQMISTISCQLKPNTTFSEIIKNTFPMGSMTGAPKKAAIEYIQQTEKRNRDWYSGTMGYIKPNGDFSLNVVIRSILYNERTKFASLSAGSAITSLANAEEEYEECLLKAQAMINALK